MPSNNDFLSDLADETRGHGKTNNQLLEQVALKSISETPIVRQNPITKLDHDAVSEWDIISKINEIVDVLKDANVTE